MSLSSKLHQRCLMFLIIAAIFALVVVIVLVWVQYGNTNSRPNKKYNVTFNYEESSNLDREEFVTIGKDGATSIYQPTVETENEPKLPNNGKQYTSKQNNVQYVTPLKIPSVTPLHDHDILYDHLHNYTLTDSNIRHHSGHFRHRGAEVWDPHPQYEIEAFGKKMVLELAHNDKAVFPELYITHFSENNAQKRKHDTKLAGCFYTGKLKNDPNSKVTVSLCHGMTGYIHSSFGNFYIEPSDEFQNGSTPLQHRITKIEKGDTNLPKITHDADQCETQDQMVIDDEIIHESARHTHYRKKREALFFDYIDEVVPEMNNTEYIRKPRQAFKKIPQYVRRKRTEKEYYIELLVVADRTMLEYHKTQENMEQYIHTLMLHVSTLFKDATIGNPISLAVVKISIDMDTIYPPLSNEMLKKFCEWQKLNYVNDVQHDAALLLTRNQICRASDPNTCHTLGIAEVGAMCSENSSCALVRDNGLSTSYTIAHELGHLLNMRHDETSQCLGTNGGRTAGIMNKSLHNDSSPWRWSTCSKYFLTEFLDSSRSNCLLDQPQFNEITQDIGVFLPGENYEVDMQCELEFEGSKICSHMGTTCNVLWCTTSNGGCQTQYMPWADGTTCGMNSWCHDRKCIEKNRESLTPIHGNWSAYQGWSSCSRTCGGGIKSSKRFCNSPAPANGGSYCAGGGTKYSSCNVEECPKDSPDFREQQCAKFDGDPMTIPGLNQTVQWVPKYGMGSKDREEDYCKLYCRVKNNKEHFQLKNKVIDGTKCSLYNFGICVNGICKPGGCDNQLDSSSRLDACGVCNGDNSTCREITGHFNVSDIHNYTRVTTIPKGSFNIMIKQYGFHDQPDDTFIALVGDDNKYLANQDYGITLYEKYIYYGGIKLTYSGSQNMVETVISQKYKKLQRDLYLEVVSIIHRPPDISYQYSIETNKAPKYGWHFYATNWTDCSATCNGMQTMIPVCVDLDTGYHADYEKCAELGNNNNLRSERKCNTHCEFVWNATKTGACSKHCGKGLQEVEFNCVMVNSDYGKGYYEYSVVDDKDGIPVDESQCYRLRKPSQHQICHGSCDFARWIYEDWTQCSKSCDRGVKSRRARCVNAYNTTVDESICDAQSKKFVIQACNAHSCPTWTYGPWSECSAPCGKGIQNRSYICDFPGSCNLDELQPIEKECDVAECQWHISDWSKCSATCGDGLQTREVSCRVDSVIQVSDMYCGNLLKPDDRKRCDANKNCYDPAVFLGDNNEIDDDDDYHRYSTFKWNVGRWSKCSKSCEGGVQSRQVLCRDLNGNIDETRCDIQDKPKEHENCNTFECPKWIHGEFGDCNSNCEKLRQVGCQNHEGNLVTEGQCPTRSKPNHKIKCPCPNHTRSNDIIRNVHSGNRRFGKSLYKWKKSSWNRCSSTCGKGNQTRNVYCMDIGHEAKVVDSFCHQTRKPKDVRPCEHYDKYNCNYTWSETPWSKCSISCNDGVKHRNVTCHKVLPGGVVQPTTVHPSHCDFHAKPPTQATCIERNCYDKHRWHADQWSKCTEACGKQGVQSRKLFCLNNRGMRVQKRLCPKEFRPLKKRKCNRVPCRYTSCKDVKEKLRNSTNTDYHLHIAGKIAVVYCFKMDTNHPEEFITLEPGRTNYAQFYDKRLHRPNSCPRNIDPDNCDCTKIPTSTHPVGKTEFWKVRLNITSMQIIAEDYTFSQSTDHPQKFGHAGDCYSSVQNCIRGSFSVDLTGTSFKVSDRVTWYSSGNSASTDIKTSDRQLIHGYCGGNCGTCGPHPHHGLLVEVT